MRSVIGGIANGDLPFHVALFDENEAVLARFEGRGRGMVLKPNDLDAYIREPSTHPTRVRLGFAVGDPGGGDKRAATLVSATNLSLGDGQYLRTFITEDTICGRSQSMIVYLIVLNARE
ncbi:MAG: hypothetical protein K2W85_10740 [Phycisphaerales bacterium]|nr:hypothetical protein [Phycisphaerales bacterium]